MTIKISINFQTKVYFDQSWNFVPCSISFTLFFRLIWYDWLDKIRNVREDRWLTLVSNWLKQYSYLILIFDKKQYFQILKIWIQEHNLFNFISRNLNSIIMVQKYKVITLLFNFNASFHLYFLKRKPTFAKIFNNSCSKDTKTLNQFKHAFVDAKTNISSDFVRFPMKFTFFLFL